MNQAKVLFVDDEVGVLRSLKRGLRLRRRDWDIQFHQSPLQALDQLDQFSPWIVVSDKRMSEMDGLDFLAQVRERLPEAVRILLSGDTSGESALGATEVSHLLLAKPFDIDELIEILERTYCLYSLPVSAKSRQVLGDIKTLPVLPEVYQCLVDYLRGTDQPDVKKIAEIISRDTAILSKVLQVSNSSFFGFSSPAQSIQEAVVRLGNDLLSQMVLSIGLFEESELDQQSHRALLAQSEKISEQMLTMARFADVPKQILDKLYITGLLHNVGALAPEVDHPDSSHIIGAYLLKLWGFEAELVNAVLYQNDNEYIDESLLLPFLRVALALDDEKGGTDTLNFLPENDLRHTKVQAFLQQI